MQAFDDEIHRTGQLCLTLANRYQTHHGMILNSLRTIAQNVQRQFLLSDETNLGCIAQFDIQLHLHRELDSRISTSRQVINMAKFVVCSVVLSH